MAKAKKICFVIMGFGLKTDFSIGKTLDLDKTYKNIIQPAVELSGYQCVRADEIQDSGIIDKSMYALLMQADLVVADISTYNPNAIYELGIRHAVKPYSTIVINAEGSTKIPFDLDHTRIFHYKHSGEDIGTDESKRCQSALSDLIATTTKNSLVDSPLYSYLDGINPPKLPKKEYDKIIGELAEKEGHIFAIVEKAKEHMNESEFSQAAKLWDKASEILPNESYFIQQHALSTYKSKDPSEGAALTDGLRIIEKLDPDNDTNDPETLGLTGAIYKRLYELHDDKEYLKRAIQYYEKGFHVRSDYYTGENYALCLDMIANVETDDDERTFFKVLAKKTRKQILEILEDVIEERDIVNNEYKWAYATLSNCFYGIGDDEQGRVFEDLFRQTSEASWEIETFEGSKDKLFNLVRGK